MRTIQLAVACVAVLVASAGQVQASMLTFDAQPEQYFVSTITEGAYVFNSNFDGFGTNNYPLWPSNGTMHLMSWTNYASLSGFTLSHSLGNLFNVSSFDFAGGYVIGGDPVSSLTVTGFLGASIIQTASFTGGIDFTASGPSSLTTLSLFGFSGVDSLVVEATGSSNRAQYDNFVVSEGAAAVPEPTSIALFGIGACVMGLGASRRRHRAKK